MAFAWKLGASHPLVDRTGLSGTIDFMLEWLPVSTGPAQPTAEPDPEEPGPSFQEALAKQLGLKLEPRRAPMEVLVLIMSNVS